MVLNFDNTETLVGNLTCGLFPPIQNEIENYLDNDFLKFSISRSISIVHSALGALEGRVSSGAYSFQLKCLFRNLMLIHLKISIY